MGLMTRALAGSAQLTLTYKQQTGFYFSATHTLERPLEGNNFKATWIVNVLFLKTAKRAFKKLQSAAVTLTGARIGSNPDQTTNLSLPHLANLLHSHVESQSQLYHTCVKTGFTLMINQKALYRIKVSQIK